MPSGEIPLLQGLAEQNGPLRETPKNLDATNRRRAVDWPGTSRIVLTEASLSSCEEVLFFERIPFIERIPFVSVR
jgi:hypothetical protein